MIGNLKTGGIAFIVILASSAIVASATSAQFHSERETTTLTVSSSETQVFGLKAGSATKVECEKITTDATVILPEVSGGDFTGTDIKAFPEYDDCKAEPLGLVLHVDFNDCYFTFTLAAGATTSDSTHTTHLECLNTGGVTEDVTWTVTKEGTTLCTFHFPEQTLEGVIHFENSGTATTREIRVNPTVTGIDSTRTGSLLCGSASSTTGTYGGKFTVTGEQAGAPFNHAGVWAE